MEKGVHREFQGGIREQGRDGRREQEERESLVREDRDTGDEAGFCEAGIREVGDTDARRRLISPRDSLSINDQCEVMGISKGKLFYEAKGTSKQDPEMMKEMGKEHMYNPGKESSTLPTFLCVRASCT